jgi:hypothetical protein
MDSQELAAEIHQLEALVRLHVGKLASLNLAITVHDGKHTIQGAFVLLEEAQEIDGILIAPKVVARGTVAEVVEQITARPVLQ